MRRDEQFRIKSQQENKESLLPPEQDNWREKGANMLAKMGWKEGQGLGKHGAGIKEALATKVVQGRQGLGAVGQPDRADVMSKVGEFWFFALVCAYVYQVVLGRDKHGRVFLYSLWILTNAKEYIHSTHAGFS